MKEIIDLCELFLYLGIGVFFIFVIIFVPSCFVRPELSTDVLTQAGYTDIKIKGYAWFACSNDDWISAKFMAKGPTGIETKGAVCCGLIFKNCTIRFS